MAPVRETKLPTTNKIFVDRGAPQRIFEDAAFAIPRDRAAVRVFYGVGGQGKTALCRELVRKTGPAGDPSYAFLRRALLDLHGKVKTDPDLLLVWIRNAFAEADVSFACFDLALALMWECERGEQPFPTLAKPWLGRATGAAKGAADEGAKDAADWLHGDVAKDLLGDLVAEIPGVGFILKRLGHWVIDRGKKAWLLRTREPLQKLFRDGEPLPAYEISKLLPWMLAQDLNHHLERHPTECLVLFVDEYERVFDEGGAGAAWRENEFDRNMRSLVQHTNSLLAVFFSRERLPWEELRDWRDDLKDNQHLLGGLADKDAEDFLKAIPIEDATVRNAIINGARETSARDAPVYPLMLDLQVEHWRNLFARCEASPGRFTVEAETFEDRRVELIERMLRDYGAPLQTTIERLSVARRFDREAFRCIVETFHTAVPLDSFERIAALSFVTRADDGFLVLHNVVRSAICEQLSADKRRSSIDALLAHFSDRARVASHFELDDAKIAALVEATYLRREQGSEGYVDWLAEIATPLVVAARYSTAGNLWREALSFLLATAAPENADIATSTNNLAYILEKQGRFTEAEPLYRRALQIYERVLGSDHPDTARSHGNLASTLDAQRRLGEAEPLHRVALETLERVLGPDHPDTAASYNNLALCLKKQGRLAEAEPLYRRALQICERVLGPHHPHTATSYGNLAQTLDAEGRLGEAEPLHRKALDIIERALSADHPATAMISGKLACNLDAQGKLGEAEPLHRKALDIIERALSADHPATAICYNDLATNLYTQGRPDEAEPLFRRALEISERALGADHPTSINIRSNYRLHRRD